MSIFFFCGALHIQLCDTGPRLDTSSFPSPSVRRSRSQRLLFATDGFAKMMWLRSARVLMLKRKRSRQPAASKFPFTRASG